MTVHDVQIVVHPTRTSTGTHFICNIRSECIATPTQQVSIAEGGDRQVREREPWRVVNINVIAEAAGPNGGRCDQPWRSRDSLPYESEASQRMQVSQPRTSITYNQKSLLVEPV